MPARTRTAVAVSASRVAMPPQVAVDAVAVAEADVADVVVPLAVTVTAGLAWRM